MARIATELRERLHSVFDPDPAPVLALRVRHALGASWEVSGDALAVRAGEQAAVYALSAYTLSGLASALAADGFEVAHFNPALGARTAALLLEGAGDQGESNGDHLYAYTSLLAIVLGVLGRADETARAAIAQALSQLLIPESTAEWADLFGEIFGVARLPAEPDAPYTARILEEVKRNRSSPAAMLRNIKRLSGLDLEVREPWREVFHVSGSALSGPHHLQGAPVYQYHTAQLISREGIDWTIPSACAQADRPAGTLLLDASVQPWAIVPDGFLLGDALPLWRDDALMGVASLFSFLRLSATIVLSGSPRTDGWLLPRHETVLLQTEPLRMADITGESLWIGSWSARTWRDVREREIYVALEEALGS